MGDEHAMNDDMERALDELEIGLDVYAINHDWNAVERGMTALRYRLKMWWKVRAGAAWYTFRSYLR